MSKFDTELTLATGRLAADIGGSLPRRERRSENVARGGDCRSQVESGITLGITPHSSVESHAGSP
jgi:hypothetical protein